MSANSSNELDNYLIRLNAALLNIPNREREEFLREIKAHILEKLREEGSTIGTVIRILGEPSSLAREFESEYGMNLAARSWSPLLLMKSAARWALTGVQGFSIFVIASMGYILGAVFCITAVLKPVFPEHIGFYVGQHGLNLAGWPTPQGRELLGADYTLVAFLVGVLLVAMTSFAVRAMMRRFAGLRSWLT